MLSALPVMIEHSAKSARFAQKKVISSKKLPLSQVETFLKSNFDLTQICKTVLTQKPLNLKF